MVLLEEIKMFYDPLDDGKSYIKLVDFMGGDLAIVNDARTSFDRESIDLTEKDIKLINYLIKHKHYSPLRSTVFKFKVKAPLFICRQWFKHTVASSFTESQDSWNEKSFRYTDLREDAEFYIPSDLRAQAIDNRQASVASNALNDHLIHYTTACYFAHSCYTDMVKSGVCREQARNILPPAIYTTFVWTVSLQGLLHFVALRKGKEAQYEIAAYADVLDKIVGEKVPYAHKAFTDSYSDV